MIHTGFLIRTSGDVSERGKGSCPYMVPPGVFGLTKTEHTIKLLSYPIPLGNVIHFIYRNMISNLLPSMG